MNIGNALKVVLGIAATILLGAIGSGVWEKILSPGLTYTGDFITSTISSMSVTYSDSIYSRASNIVPYDNSQTLAGFIFILVFIWLFLFALSTKKDNKFISIIHKSIVDQFSGWWGIVYSGAFVIVLIFFVSTESTVTRVKNYSIKQMDILRPYIGEENYHILRSKYLRIESRDDFDKFLESLNKHSKNSSIEIEKLKGV